MIIYDSFAFDSFPVNPDIYLSSCSHVSEYFGDVESNDNMGDKADDFS